jgi:hypothetical protein
MKHFILFASLIVFSSYSTIFAACGNGQSTVRVEITPDNYPGETSWSLRDKLTNALIDTGQILGDTICIGSSQCVVFTIFDAASDGLCCGYGQGSYRVFLTEIKLYQEVNLATGRVPFSIALQGYSAPIRLRQLRILW